MIWENVCCPASSQEVWQKVMLGRSFRLGFSFAGMVGVKSIVVTLSEQKRRVIQGGPQANLYKQGYKSTYRGEKKRYPYIWLFIWVITPVI